MPVKDFISMIPRDDLDLITDDNAAKGVKTGKDEDKNKEGKVWRPEHCKYTSKLN